MKKTVFFLYLVIFNLIVFSQTNSGLNLEINDGLYKKFILNDVGLILNIYNEKFDNEISFYPIDLNDENLWHNDIQDLIRNSDFFSTSKEVFYPTPVLDMFSTSIYILHGTNIVKTFYYDCCRVTSLDSLIKIINSIMLSHSINDTIQIVWCETCDSCIMNEIDIFQREDSQQGKSYLKDFHFELVLDNCRIFTFYYDTGLIFYDSLPNNNSSIFIPCCKKRRNNKNWFELCQNLQQIVQQEVRDTLPLENSYILSRINGKWGYINIVNSYEIEKAIKIIPKIASLQERRKLKKSNTISRIMYLLNQNEK